MRAPVQNKNRIPIRMTQDRRWTFPLTATFWAAASLTGMALLSGCAADKAPEAKASSGWVKDQVADAYTFGFPLVVSDIARERASGNAGQPGRAPLNTFRHATALPPVGATGWPTVDTLDSTAWLDVSAEPVIVSLPAAPRGRYLDARAFDAWTNALYSSADTTPYPKAQLIAFVPAGWTGTVPANATRVETRTRYVWLSVRVRVNGPRDVREARKLQTAMRIDTATPANGAATDAGATPAVVTGAWPGNSSGQSPAVPALATAPPTASPGAQAEALDANAFFARLARALDANPPATADTPAMNRLASLGVKPGEPVQFKKTDAPLLDSGVADARTRLATVPANAITKNGWTWFGDGVGVYGTDYILRAYLARHQIATTTKNGELKPVAHLDSEGHALNGANQYVLHFAPNQLPPVRGFWTLIAYTKDGALADDKLARIALSDRDRLKKNRDGSIDVVVSAEAPGKARASNWLPAPDGEFQLTMRLYAPKPQASDGTWAPPAIERQ
ncbi:lipoprotein [Caballeronia grimmiae]|uniref:Lipoprotein n=2 Tax=Caballeronia grimmiae TaxID=1071679 RepID=A0ABQ1RV63_9BURK|nr:lipoprotein [Caballeronia grimmiae]